MNKVGICGIALLLLVDCRSPVAHAQGPETVPDVSQVRQDSDNASFFDGWVASFTHAQGPETVPDVARVRQDSDDASFFSGWAASFTPAQEPETVPDVAQVRQDSDNASFFKGWVASFTPAQESETVPDVAQVTQDSDNASSFDGWVESSTPAALQGYRPGSRLSRWWHERTKPCLQYSHWGYPEYFEETPLGASLGATQSVQICNGWASRLMLYHYDFCDGAPSLNFHGQRRLNELATTFPTWAHLSLRVQATPDDPGLGQARREYVAKVLAGAGVPARVEIGWPTEVSPFGDETRIVNQNLLRRVQSGRPLAGTSVGGGMAVSGGGNRDNSGNSGQSQ